MARLLYTVLQDFRYSKGRGICIFLQTSTHQAGIKARSYCVAKPFPPRWVEECFPETSRNSLSRGLEEAVHTSPNPHQSGADPNPSLLRSSSPGLHRFPQHLQVVTSNWANAHHSSLLNSEDLKKKKKESQTKTFEKFCVATLNSEEHPSDRFIDILSKRLLIGLRTHWQVSRRTQ